MRAAVWLMLLGIFPIAVDAAGSPDWAFPVADKVQPPLQENDQPKSVAGSAKSFTQAQIDDLKNPVLVFGYASGDGGSDRTRDGNLCPRLVPFADRHRS